MVIEYTALFLGGICVGSLVVNIIWSYYMKAMLDKFYDGQDKLINDFYMSMKSQNKMFYATLKTFFREVDSGTSN